MSDRVYKTIELTGSSAESVEDAVQTAVVKAGESVHNLRWFQVTEIRGGIRDGLVESWQVSLKVGFTLDS
jgi:dodecin